MSKLHVMGLFAAALALGTFLFTGCCGAGSALDDYSEKSAALEAAEATDSGSGDSSGAKKYCNNVESEGLCNVYTPATFAILGEETFKDLCEMRGGTWASDACPTENQVGICDDGSGLFTHYYSTGKTINFTAETAKKDCEELDGKFSEK